MNTVHLQYMGYNASCLNSLSQSSVSVTVSLFDTLCSVLNPTSTDYVLTRNHGENTYLPCLQEGSYRQPMTLLLLVLGCSHGQVLRIRITLWGSKIRTQEMDSCDLSHVCVRRDLRVTMNR